MCSCIIANCTIMLLLRNNVGNPLFGFATKCPGVFLIMIPRLISGWTFLRMEFEICSCRDYSDVKPNNRK